MAISERYRESTDTIAQRRRDVGGALMSIALLSAIESTGIRLHAEGDQLRAEIPAGADLGPFRERIRQHKPALLAEFRLREQIIAAATVATEVFDRQHYDELWRRWHALQKETV
jgi:hypothetical protein